MAALGKVSSVMSSIGGWSYQLVRRGSTSEEPALRRASVLSDVSIAHCGGAGLGGAAAEVPSGRASTTSTSSSVYSGTDITDAGGGSSVGYGPGTGSVNAESRSGTAGSAGLIGNVVGGGEGAGPAIKAARYSFAGAQLDQVPEGMTAEEYAELQENINKANQMLQDEQQELRQQEMDLYISKFQEQLAIDQKMVPSAKSDPCFTLSYFKSDRTFTCSLWQLRTQKVQDKVRHLSTAVMTAVVKFFANTP